MRQRQDITVQRAGGPTPEVRPKARNRRVVDRSGRITVVGDEKVWDATVPSNAELEERRRKLAEGSD